MKYNKIVLIFCGFYCFILLFSCGNKVEPPRVSPAAEVADTAMLKTQGLGFSWYPYIDETAHFRFKVPRNEFSDFVEDEGVIKFMGWLGPDSLGFQKGLVRQLIGEPGFLVQIFRRPLYAYGKDFNEFSEFGAEVYHIYAGNRKRPLSDGEYFMLQDSTIQAFRFETTLDFGQDTRTPILNSPDLLDDEFENTLQRSPAVVVYLSHQQYNFRIIYEKNNVLAAGMFTSMVFF